MINTIEKMQMQLAHRILMVAMIMYILADILITFYIEELPEPHFVTGIKRMVETGDKRSMMFGAVIVAAGILTWFVSKQL